MEKVKAILKVKEADYIPSYVTLRAKISTTIFTVELLSKDLELLEKDVKVHSISIARTMAITQGEK